MAAFLAGNLGGIDLSAFDLAALTQGVPTDATPTVYRFPDIEFQGFGFTYTGDDLSGGTINTIIVFGGGQEAYRVSGLNLTVTAEIAGFISNGESQNFLAAIFASADTFVGSAANDHLRAFAGIDKLLGGNGDDTLDGGDDNDVVNGGAGNDSLLGGLGVDQLLGEAGNDTLLGGAGDDTLIGSAGDDSMDGGEGKDTYDVNVTTDIAVDSGLGAERDVVISLATWTLHDSIEDLTLAGSAEIDATGNASNNVLTGNGAANVLDGKAGADTMRGGGGDDIYIVDNDKDEVDESPPGSGGIDIVKSSVSFTLGLNVNHLELTGAGGINGTGNALSNGMKGNAGKNQLSGLDGDDALSGMDGDDELNGGIGRDSMFGGFGDDVYFVDNLLDEITEEEEEGSKDTVKSSISYELTAELEDLVLLGNFDLTGVGNSEKNQIVGNDANNTLAGDDKFENSASGFDTLLGGKGDDTYFVWYASDMVIEDDDSGHDLVKSVATFTLGDHVEDLELISTVAVHGTGNDLANKITGNGRDNKLNGAAGNDSLNGGIATGNDTLDGGLGDDTMVGAAGDDVYMVDSLQDVIVDSSGTKDEVHLSGTDVGLVKLYTGIEHYDFSQFGAGPISFTGTTAGNRIVGTAANDTLLGGSGNDTLDGGAGEDSLDGGTGNDTYVVDVDKDIISDSGKDAGDTVQTATLQIDLTLDDFKGIENVTLTDVSDKIFNPLNATGADARNVLIGNSADNLLRGFGNNDTLIGGAGDDDLDGGAGSDSMAGGSGNDSYEVDATGDKIVEGPSAGTDIVTSKISYVLGDNVENLQLEGGNLNGKGNSLENIVLGTDGKNRIDGWFGRDVMQGFDGDDTYVVIEEDDQVLEAENKGTDLVEAWADITQLYDNVENLKVMGIAGFEANGNALANVITGNGGGNKIDGKEGDDIMIGATGDDIYTVDSLGDVIVEKAGGGGDEIIFDLDSKDPSLFQTRANIEHYNFSKYETDAVAFTGDAAANRITGSSKGDILAGGTGNDTLDGSFGDDSLTGGAGNDSYVIDSEFDIVSEIVNGKDTGGKDTIVSLFTDFTLDPTVYVNIENLTLGSTDNANGTGNAAANVVTGNAFDNKLLGLGGNDTLIGNDGDDTLDGDVGNDSLVGGQGSDTYLIDSKSDRIVENISFLFGLDDTVVVGNFSYVLARGLENLILTGSADLNGTGNLDSNELTGNDGDNKLDGIANTFGTDVLAGGKGNDTYYVHVVKGQTVIGDTVIELLDEGIDTVIVDAKLGASKLYSLAENVENLTLRGSLGSKGLGNDLDNLLVGNAGANALQGDAGNDTLDGGAGADTLTGGLDDDIYVIDNIKDVIQELGDGIDTIQAKISIDLANYKNFNLDVVENVTLTGSGALSAAGNGFNNHLIGNTGANKLNGNGGDDTLEGGRGNDILDGGTGNDTFLYASKLDGRDVINGFEGDTTGQDALDLDALFDSLNVATDLRDDRIALNDKGSSVEVRVDVDGKAVNGAEFLVATLNTADDIAVGADVLVGTL
jgi:Ca2+-binding RTX toxin-like protein